VRKNESESGGERYIYKREIEREKEMAEKSDIESERVIESESESVLLLERRIQWERDGDIYRKR